MSFEVSASALEAQRIRMDVIANNIANAQSTRTEDGGPYRRRAVVFEAVGGGGNRFRRMLESAEMDRVAGSGVRVARIVEAQGPEAFIEVYDPTNPDADSEGIVRKPNIRVVDEMVNLIDASRAYEANITALNTTRQINNKTLEIGRTA
ncbi:MAG: flagellar basal body rod protein FlgC [Candidatus Omnitrophica bacterium]|nr:Flagellar basal-body rod protein FlgC [bacterium]NUN95471.1 flagellar basal body rod protein FlgC [Candidatus Omnitrophota bacterium]